jgi:probable rRNA maturation factor
MITIDPPSTIPIAALSSPGFKPGLTRFLSRARLAVGLPGEVEVLLADDQTLRRLNKDFRGKNKPTDVLSFPTPAEIADHHAGDLAISLEIAARQAEAYGHTLIDEVRILILHGLLHLSGEDHETDDGEMAAREADLRLQLRLPVSLIERVEKASPKLPKTKPTRKIAKPNPKAAKPSSASRSAKPKVRRSS